ncbi:hypothetical protein GJ697_16210 [Pseudoduganella sp. FT25W]|uniref:Uncharacterized protein n=1 Tax=Duganella alba TaxID=2666081 RepID=A0A6L5QHY6_9BURK|nr:hypothetical protein [Duganella alba]MRX09386.1 hypothetical protein [Duganella alba]MRX17717.1 hypothetical protein [Duganella alba]
MKHIIIHPARFDREAYAIDRMSQAAQRLLHAHTIADEIRAGQWVLAWAVAAGVRPSARALARAMALSDPLSLH